jgi:hypothetical protein
LCSVGALEGSHTLWEKHSVWFITNVWKEAVATVYFAATNGCQKLITTVWIAAKSMKKK